MIRGCGFSGGCRIGEVFLQEPLATGGIVRTVLCTYANETEDKSYRGRSGEGRANDSAENDRFDGSGGGSGERPLRASRRSHCVWTPTFWPGSKESGAAYETRINRALRGVISKEERKSWK
jgi:hypothetical protein